MLQYGLIDQVLEKLPAGAIPAKKSEE
jgi:hypothetical protein